MRLALLSSLLLLLPLSVHAEEKLAAVDTARDHIRGDRTAAASFVVYADFECPFCKRFHETLESVRKNHPHIRIVYRNFPLSFHAQAMAAATATECVGKALGDAGYWPFVDAVFGMETLSAAALRALAMEQGVDSDSYDTCLQTAAIADKISWDQDSGILAGVTGTPNSFLIKEDGSAIRIDGAVEKATLEKYFAKIAAPARSSSPRITTTKRSARVRAVQSVRGVRRWK